MRKHLARITMAIATVLMIPTLVFGETCEQGACPTGDSFNYAIPIILMAAALLLVLIAVIMGRKKKK